MGYRWSRRRCNFSVHPARHGRGSRITSPFSGRVRCRCTGHSLPLKRGHRPELEAFQHPHIRSSAGFPECEMLAIRSRNRPADRHLCILEYSLGPSPQVNVQQRPFSSVGIGGRPQTLRASAAKSMLLIPAQACAVTVRLEPSSREVKVMFGSL